MRCLDLFCGAGGAAMGLHRAGFTEIVGVDHVAQPRYPFEFVCADAMEYPLGGFDFIWASPPCQKWSVAGNVHRNRGKEYSDCLTPIRQRLREWGGSYVIENVIGAPCEEPIVLCGLMFGLKVFRHRFFESNHLVLCPPHPPHAGKRIGEGYYSVAGGAGRWKNWNGVQRNVNKGTRAEWRDAMGIDWMIRKELTQAIPPAYSEYLGRQVLGILERRAGVLK